MSYGTFFHNKCKDGRFLTDKPAIYEIPHELPKDIRLKILGN